MLHQFFIMQWNNPTKGDWTQSVREDLKDFGIKFNDLKGMSKNFMKKLIKKNAREYAFNKLMGMKEQNSSKLGQLKYKKLKRQAYMKQTKKNIINIFKFRTHMAEFGENYRAGYDAFLCPLCLEHLDNQQNSLKCKSLQDELEFKKDISDIYSNEITEETIQIINIIIKIRKKLIERDSTAEESF